MEINIMDICMSACTHSMFSNEVEERAEEVEFETNSTDEEGEEEEDSDEEKAIHVTPTVPGTQNNGNESAKEDVDWFKPPPPPTSLPPPPSLRTIPTPITSFELGMSLSFYDGTGQVKTVVYKGVMPDGLTHTVRRKDGTRLNVHDAHLCLKMQADLTSIPRMPLDYCKEIGKGILKEEAEALACPGLLSPVQKGVMDWHHRLYHLSFP